MFVLLQRVVVQSEDGERVTFNSTLTPWSLFKLNLTNTLIVIFTLGLGYPWVAVRSARYYASRTEALAMGGLDGFVAAEGSDVTAMGEEIGDAFDLDLGFGV